MRSSHDRVVHATFPGLGEVVRYDREGRWYFEVGGTKKRLPTVKDAVAKALELEERGGVIHLGRPGGNRFDYMVEAAWEKKARQR